MERRRGRRHFFNIANIVGTLRGYGQGLRGENMVMERVHELVHGTVRGVRVTHACIGP